MLLTEGLARIETREEKWPLSQEVLGKVTKITGLIEISLLYVRGLVVDIRVSVSLDKKLVINVVNLDILLGSIL